MEKSGIPVIAFDKTIRDASKRSTDKLYLVSAYNYDSNLTLLLNRIDSSKSNEISAVRELLLVLNSIGTMTTLDVYK